jgi:hypothetical protein
MKGSYMYKEFEKGNNIYLSCILKKAG